MPSPNRLDGKNKRRARRAITKDLKSKKYRQRVIPNKKKDKKIDEDDWRDGMEIEWIGGPGVDRKPRVLEVRNGLEDDFELVEGPTWLRGRGG